MAASIPLFNSLSSLSFLNPLLQSPTPPSSSSSRLPLPSSSSPLSKTIKFQKPLSQIISKESNTSLSPDLLSVLYPSAVYSNTLCFKSGYNVQVIVEEDETAESLVDRFRREVLRARVLQECKRRRWRETNQEKRKRKSREAAQRYGIGSRRRQQARMQQQAESKQFKEVDDDDDDYNDAEDNWEVGDVDLN